jgi:sulfotransferase family protein
MEGILHRQVSIRPLDFLVIGAPKSGTTSLFQYIRHHPQIFIPPQKELPFFCNDELFSQGWDHFSEEYFADASDQSLIGKVTPQYMKFPQTVAERLYRTMPSVKLMALLRNPIDRAFSHYRMAYRRGWKQQSSISFEETITRETDPTFEWDPAGCLGLGCYARILQIYLNSFPKEQLLILFAEDLQDKPQKMLNEILLFLDLERGFLPGNLNKKYHVGGNKQRFPYLKPAIRKIAPVWWLWKKMPKPQKETFKKWWNMEANVDTEPAPQLPEETRRRLAEYYASDVRNLEAIIGRNVPWLDFQNASNLS